ncbi:MAG: aminotransferase class V-fold PLP-dependent enzyme [Candidatus Omnitrophica bacterium]|nr:aminotransferase class V-fold PLP-dependent enzyme [Candidatus Omnitrophota bacterium]
MDESYAKDFGPFENTIWLNSASEGPVSKVSVDALQEATSWKVNPAYLTHQRFAEVPAKLKNAIGRLINANASDVILGNSATYGIHLLAKGFPFQSGDEIILMRNDFPTDILPWLTLQPQGVTVRQLPSRLAIISPEEILAAISPKTKLICLPHVHTFSGQILDIETIGKFCRERNIIFVVNVSQSLGYMPIDLETWPVDAITSAGFKWLCGPYGTGICWMKKELREKLNYQQAFWVNVLTEEELGSTGDLHFTPQTSAKSLDVFGTANFFNFVPLTAAIEYFLHIGIANVSTLIAERVERFITSLDKQSYTLLSSTEKEKRSALIVFSHMNREKNDTIFRKLLENKIFLAKWKGNLRISPHIFNTSVEIEKTLDVLHGCT